jgi:hypothetical protein
VEAFLPVMVFEGLTKMNANKEMWSAAALGCGHHSVGTAASAMFFSICFEWNLAVEFDACS